MWFAISETCFLLFVVLATVYFCLKYHFGYWQRHNVPEIKPNLIVGNLGGMLSMQGSPADFIRGLYNHPQAVDKPFVGLHVFHTPAVFVRDPKLLKNILIKDFTKFSNRYSNSDQKGDPMGSKNLFFLKSPTWKDVRLKLSPFFTSSRLKHMFLLIEKVGCKLDTYLLNQSLEDNKLQSFCLEMKEFCALYTTDVIATVAYGVEANSFKNPNGDFRRNGRQVFHFSLLRAASFVMVFFLPHLVPYFRFKIVPAEPTLFLRTTINYVIKQREQSGQPRNDLIDILIEFKNWSKNQNAADEFVFDEDIIVAQAAIFFTAGFESSSATMSFALYELAKRKDLQKRLREEIRNALASSGGKVTQHLIDSLAYLNMVIAEVLRLYPPLPFLDRECTVEEGSHYSLQPFDEFEMPRGMPVYIPVYGLHMDPKYYPKPEVFDPERFSLENKRNLIPYTYMPFGLGPHACIGERFGILQTKIGLVHFFRNHYVDTCAKTQLKMKLDPKAIILQAKGGIHLNVVRDPLNV